MCIRDRFDVDYLEHIKTEDRSPLVRESLYVRFDPLLSKQSPKASDEHETHVPIELADRFVIHMCNYGYKVYTLHIETYWY